MSAPRISARCEIRAAATESVAVISSVHSPHAGELSIDERKPSATEAVVAALIPSGCEVFDRRLIVGSDVHQTSPISETTFSRAIGDILSAHESSERVYFVSIKNSAAPRVVANWQRQRCE